ncbi:NTE family protein [Psychroflexus salarius]|uniref:NTE family protein n=1 Tax=Psychroflexus salarius TaxID=1155689 RepID=A0A1M4VMC3_9FLAO|nr:patatin-like phospholipase family protein [Psychroflexus salarius]SHE70221.1 NTE family protein [Psychroflexus salarius]
MTSKILLLSFLLSWASFAFQPQDIILPTNDTLKVGLVLSGGGAKGLAHIGVLKKIEEANLRIDYIGGTSMGAIVGGLYASGFSANQLDSIFRNTNFQKLIQDELPRESMTFFEKQEAERYALKLNFDRFQLKLPSGISKGQNIYNLLAQLTARLQTKDFTQLPIPFFCVVTNIETGKAEILDHGNLAEAISASGSIPTLFQPVQIDNQIYVDGGVLNNYPVEEMKRRGANFIIGVDVQDSLMTRENLKSGLDIFTQVNNFRTINVMAPKRQLTDLYIQPDIDEFTVLSFEDGAKIIQKGEEVGLQFLPAFQKIAARQDGQIQHHSKSIIDSLQVSSIAIESNSAYPRNYITGKLNFPTDEKIAFKRLNTGLNNLSATDNFRKIHYNLKEIDSAFALKLKVYDNNTDAYLRFSAHYDELYKTSVLVNYTKKSLFFENDHSSLDLILGDNLRYNFNYYIDKGKYWSIGLNSRYNRFADDVNFEFIQQNSTIQNAEINSLRLLVEDFTNQFFIQTRVYNSTIFGVGAEFKHLEASTNTLIPDEDSATGNDEFVTQIENQDLTSVYTYFKHDSFDSKYFPKQGLFSEIKYNLYLPIVDNYSEFSIFKANVGVAFPIASNLSTYLSLEGGGTIGSDNVGGLNFYLGGYGNETINNFRPFFGYDFFTISANSYLKSTIKLDYEFIKKNHLLGYVNYANADNNLYSSTAWLDAPEFTGYALGYGVETIIGPINLICSYSPEVNKTEWYISLGYWF